MGEDRKLAPFVTRGDSVGRSVEVDVDLRQVAWVAFRDGLDPILLNEFASVFWENHFGTADCKNELNDIVENLTPETVVLLEKLLEAHRGRVG
jgi:hypothetical protein